MRRGAINGILTGWLALVLCADAALAQRPAETLFPTVAPRLSLGMVPDSTVAQDATACPDCNPPKRLGWAFAELMIVQAIPALWNKVRRGEV